MISGVIIGYGSALKVQWMNDVTQNNRIATFQTLEVKVRFLFALFATYSLNNLLKWIVKDSSSWANQAETVKDTNLALYNWAELKSVIGLFDFWCSICILHVWLSTEI